MTVINFPTKLRVPVKYEKPLPRQRVFYLGFVYAGPQLCQDVMNLYLKRHGKKNGVRKWSLITYGKYDENDKRKYSIEINFCDEDDGRNRCLIKRYKRHEGYLLTNLYTLSL